MKKIISILLVLIFSFSYAQKIPISKRQAMHECGEAKELAKTIAELKNSGVPRDIVDSLRKMASDGEEASGMFSLIFYDLHEKGTSTDKFSKKMYRQCMKSNGY